MYANNVRKGAFVFNRIDLFVSGDFDIPETAKALLISKVGMQFDGKIREGVVYRLKKAPQSPVNYPYLVVSDNVKEHADVLTISNFSRVREELKKRVKNGTGLEVVVAPVRKMDGAEVGRWFSDLRQLNSFCHSSKCQLIISSGATSMLEMISGPCLDAILKICDINPHRHWMQMNEWLEARLSRRVTI